LQQRGKRARIISGADGIVQVDRAELCSATWSRFSPMAVFDGIYEKTSSRLQSLGSKNPLEASAKA